MSSPVALIFGANGQDGHYLTQGCRARGYEVVGVSRGAGRFRVDVADFAAVRRLVARLRPALVFHLAAKSIVAHSAALENHQAIATGSVHVLEAVYRHAPDCRVFIAGSGLQFRNEGLPIFESDSFEASSPYAAARISAAYASRYYRFLGVKTYVGYLFHHESPLRPEWHVSQLIAAAARRAAAGLDGEVQIGDPSVEKEWAFAGDVSEAMLTLVEQDQVFEAVLGNGVAAPIAAWAESCFAAVGRDWRDHVRPKPGFVSPFRRLVSRPATLLGLGWRPTVGMKQLARLMTTGDSTCEGVRCAV